jgi:hypothetical protein
MPKKYSYSACEQVSQHAQRSPCETYAHWLANCGEKVRNEKLLEGLCTDCQQIVAHVIDKLNQGP